MPSYCVLGHTVVAGVITDGKKLSILEGTYQPGRDIPAEIMDTLDNDKVISVGAASKKFRAMDVRMQVSAVAGWASLSDVDGWYADATGAGNLWKFQDLESTTIYDVLIFNKASWRPKTDAFAPYAAASWWTGHVEIVQQ